MQITAGVVLADPGDCTHLMKAAIIDQFVDALADVQPALVSLSLDLVNAAHLPREVLAAGEIVEFRLPSHSLSPS